MIHTNAPSGNQKSAPTGVDPRGEEGFVTSKSNMDIFELIALHIYYCSLTKSFLSLHECVFMLMSPKGRKRKC